MPLNRFALALLSGLALLSASARDVLPLDNDWYFLKADALGADQPAFDDSSWRRVNLPHDWSIEGPFAQTNLTGGAGAFLPSGVAWYRKHFSLPSDALDRRVFVEFDGVMQNSSIWINGRYLGHRPNGYVGLRYELPTSALAFGNGTTNILTVCADTSAQPASRWYSGAGIYRHVRLIVTEPVHIAPDGVFVSTPAVSAAAATARIEISVTNESPTPSDIVVQTTIVSPEGETVGMMQSSREQLPGDREPIEQLISFTQPQLWDLDSPRLYHALTEVHAGDKVLDVVTTPFGVRHAEFRADSGFWLNGKNFKLKGVCLHHDGGAFGAAVPLAVWEARLNTLKSLGVNAIRTAHNPPAPEFLDLCDRLGLLVMDEFFDCWTVAKNPCDYHLYFDTWSHPDERDTILRDRNHPCVILYSVGNEIHDTPDAAKAKRILGGLVDVAHHADPTRPVTQALFRPNVSHDYDDGLADMLDVVGQNYREKEILAAHEQKPSRKILGTENTHAREQWIAVRDNPPYAGQFLWTGIDYLGESRRWPIIGHGSGLLDRTGAVRPLARERESWWGAEPMVAVARRAAATDAMPTDPGYGAEERHTQVLFADWTPKDPKPHNENVEVYSNCREVELFLNGKSLGKKTNNPDASPRNWSVPFSPGVLKAVGRSERGLVTNELRTAGPPANVVLATETTKLVPGFDNVAIIRATIVDGKGIRMPRADDLVTFKISGPGVIVAVDNGDNASHELFQTNSRHAYQGEVVAFVRATATDGKIRVTASASQWTSRPLTIRAAAK